MQFVSQLGEAAVRGRAGSVGHARGPQGRRSVPGGRAQAGSQVLMLRRVVPLRKVRKALRTTSESNLSCSI